MPKRRKRFSAGINHPALSINEDHSARLARSFLSMTGTGGGILIKLLEVAGGRFRARWPVP